VVFIIAGGTIYSNYSAHAAPSPWGVWNSIAPPMQALHSLDLDALSLGGNKIQLYAVGENGAIFARTTNARAGGQEKPGRG
jgi:hypothetical protein